MDMKQKILSAAVCLLACLPASAQKDVSATLASSREATLDNGIISLHIGSNGRADKLTFHGMNMLGSSGIYFDYTCKGPGNKALSPSKAEIVRQSDDYVEVLYTNTSDDLRWQQGYIMRKGVSGVYVYAIVNGTGSSGSVQLQEARICTRLNSSMLNGYVDDSMRGRIPSNDEMKEVENGSTSNPAYVQDATYKMGDGSIYTKYNWTNYVVRDSLHGLMHTNNQIGLWNIACSHEWMPGGPMKQELTVHATGKSPITIQMLQGEHMGAASQYYQDGERKIYGPVFIYLNYSAEKDAEALIADAKREAHEQQAQWPFAWFENELYPHDRARVSGTINVNTGQTRDSIQVVLAQPDTELMEQGKGYMFWALTDADGRFTIENVRKGNYALRAYATKGDVTDELQVKNISIDSEEQHLDTIDWTPACYEAKLLQIGENNRLADGYNLSDHARCYGLWEEVPANLTYTVGESTPSQDWYYAQCKNGKWTVLFDSPQTFTGQAHLTISAAGVTNSPKLALAVNGRSLGTWSPSPNDASIYRSGVQSGRHHLFTKAFPASYLKQGQNTLTLTMSGIGKNGGIMYDCLKLEAGAVVTSGIEPTYYAADADLTRIYTLHGVLVGTYKADVLPSEITLPRGIYIYRQSRGGKPITCKIKK